MEIVSSASVKGNVYKKTISMEAGSKIIGNINELEGATAKIFRIQKERAGQRGKLKINFNYLDFFKNLIFGTQLFLK